MKKILYLILILCITLTTCTACEYNCKHSYCIHKTIEATCTKEGFNQYKCSICWDKYKDIIPAKGHKAGEAPTLDTSQICLDCGMVLASSVDYMPYRGNDLAINQYYGYDINYISTLIDSQNHSRYMPETIQYVNKNGEAVNLSLSLPLQDFFTHSIYSILPLSTSDGKMFITDSGFKISFSFSTVDKSADAIHAWDQGLSKEFKGSDNDLVKVVGAYQAKPAYYNTIYEIIDFSNCFIELAKETDCGYVTLKKIESNEEWEAILAAETIDISNDNGSLFYESGTYRILFKYNMTWVANPPSAVYELNDEKAIYPYGKINDQYEYFYIKVTEERNNILLPTNFKISDQGFFCQLRALVSGGNTFIAENSTLVFSDKIVFKVGAKVDMTRTEYFYNRHIIEAISLTLSVYNPNTDAYDKYNNVYDLLPHVTREIAYGQEISVDIGEIAAIRDQKCRITLSYSYRDSNTGQTLSEQQNYYFTLSW